VKKILVTAAAGLALVAAPMAASAHPYHRGGDAAGAAVAAGLFGLVLGAALASSHDDGPRYDYPPAYGYDPAYQPAYYGPHCYWRTVARPDGWGRVEYRQVQVCR